MGEIKAVQVDEFDNLKNPGNYFFTTRKDIIGPAGMALCCPGCGNQSWIAIHEESPHPRWVKTGPDEAPTLKPSLNSVGCCGWHGFLTDGIFKSC